MVSCDLGWGCWCTLDDIIYQNIIYRASSTLPGGLHVPDGGVPVPAMRSLLPGYWWQGSAVRHLWKTTGVPSVTSAPSLLVQWLSLLGLYQGAWVSLGLAVERDEGDRQADTGQVDQEAPRRERR